MSPKLLDPRPYFADLADPRRETRNKLHSLHDSLMLVLCAVLSGIEDWVGMETFGKEKEAWLRTFLTLANGIASHLQGASVSLEAMGGQKAIARTLVEGGADYVLALKDNHPRLHAEVTPWLDYETARGTSHPPRP